MSKLEPLLNSEEISTMTGLSLSYLKKARQEYGLPYYKVSGVKFRLSEVTSWIQKRRQAG